MACAFALHLAFPRVGLPWVAPLALAGLFASWMSVDVPVAAAIGYLAGIVFFALSFGWFGETAGALLGPFGFLLDLGPALVEGLAFALAAALTSLAARRLSGFAVATVSAAGFALAEILRSSGLLGVPLYQIGAAFVQTPLAPLAAFGGVYGLTFTVALAGAALGAVAAQAIAPTRALRPVSRDAAVRFGATAAGIAIVTAVAWLAWPARQLGPATLRVAAVQGNIRQSVKWSAASLPLAVERYSRLTAALGRFHPAFVLWPETVITTDLLLDPTLAAVPANAELDASGRDLRQRFGALAHRLGAVLVVGSDEADGPASFNDVFFFTPSGGIEGRYRKRQLVPFAEYLPGPAWLRRLPFATLVSNFGAGTDPGPFDARLRVAPLICWEGGFTDLAQAQAAGGAAFYAIATDDAWFGDSDGPYAQAQLAQLRAIETGRWIVRAAATGISGIVAPNGDWQARSTLDTIATITGTVGEPRPTVYSRLGPWPIAAAFAMLVAAGFGLRRRRGRA